MKDKVKVYLGRIYNPLDYKNFEDILRGAVVVNSQGMIVDYGKWDVVKNRIQHIDIEKVEDFSGKLLIPGFIDLHLHLPQYACMGKRSDKLMQWLKNYIYPEETRFKHRQFAQDTARRLIADLLKNGTTTAVIYSSIHKEATDVAFEEASRSGIRAVIGKMMMDRKFDSPEELVENTEESIKQSMELCDKWHNTDKGRLMYAFAPRFAVSCSKELLAAVGKIAKEKNTYIQSHLSETKEEIDLVKGFFPDSKSYTDVYEETGILGNKTILGHAIYLDKREYDLLSRTGTRVAHLPSSNLFLKSGVMDLGAFKEKNIIVGLGSDIGAGYDLSFFKVMRDALFLQPYSILDPVGVFYMATLNGAKALSLDKEVGNFSVGKNADFLAINFQTLLNYDDKDLDIKDILSLLIYRGDDRLIEKVFIRGRQVL